jgi:ribosomal RNA-processing protein 8
VCVCAFCDILRYFAAISRRKHPPPSVIGDFGCGDAKLAASVPNVTHSFDLQAVNDRVTVCDVAHVPLEAASLDVAVFSLALMGTNWMDFIKV